VRLGIRAAVLGLAISALTPHAAEAVPAFSRQIHAGCYTCHFQSMGALNAFGRAFMMNNFALTQKMRQALQARKKRGNAARKQDSHKKGP
jgi:hypothetical protein